ncbi:hypothetical protein ACTMTU_21115 [Streptomyces sp. OZ13]|uniref:hypothetical protein n=1 Tax=Streptomyces sp. OZ13 TaxID=3452210 RepID=UPI003F8A8D39
MALYVFGLYVAAAVFTVVYLRFQAKSSWLFSGLYAAVLVAAVHALFGLVLTPVPPPRTATRSVWRGRPSAYIDLLEEAYGR